MALTSRFRECIRGDCNLRGKTSAIPDLRRFGSGRISVANFQAIGFVRIEDTE